MKSLLAQKVSQEVRDGQTIGLGSGSTAELALGAIGERVKKEKLKIRGVATSYRIAELAREQGIEVISSLVSVKLDWAFDGADEVDPEQNMIKGRGAAMLQEKILARRASRLIIVVTEDKLVQQLGEHFPVPVEVIPEAQSLVRCELERLGAASIQLRDGQSKYGPCVTEGGNVIFDVRFKTLNEQLAKNVKQLTGVVETGLFYSFAPEVFVAKESGIFCRKLVGGKLCEEKLAS